MTVNTYQWDQFIDEAKLLFANVTDKSTLDDELLIRQLGALASRQPVVPETKVFKNAGLGPSIATGPIRSEKGLPFFVLLWTLEAGAILPAHNHPNYSFCTLGIKGEVRIQNFETVGAVPEYESRQSFKVRKTQDQLLTPGRVNTLTRSRDYIHQLEAGNDYAMGIDIGILHTKDVGFSYLKVSDDTTGAITTAHWNKALTDKVRA